MNMCMYMLGEPGERTMKQYPKKKFDACASMNPSLTVQPLCAIEK